jgi:hypothetical protein
VCRSLPLEPGLTVLGLEGGASRAGGMADFATGDVPMQPKQGMPGAKQQQSEESLPALDEEERKAVLQRSRARLEARGTPGTVTPKSGRAPSAKTPKSGRSSLPGYMTPKTGGRSSRSGAKSSRSSALTNRTSSPTGRYHPDVERRLDIRKVRAPSRSPAPRHPIRPPLVGPASVASPSPPFVPGSPHITCLLSSLAP